MLNPQRILTLHFSDDDSDDDDDDSGDDSDGDDNGNQHHRMGSGPLTKHHISGGAVAGIIIGVCE